VNPLSNPNPDDLSRWTDEELWKAFLTAMGLTAASLAAAAMMLPEIQKRGLDLSRIPRGYLDYLRLIRSGQVLPDAVERFASLPSLVKAIAQLPHDDQRRLASGEPVKLLVFGDDGKRTHRMVNPLDMLPEQIKQVFDKGRIRDEAAQALVLDAENARRRQPKPEVVGQARIDKERRCVIVGNRTFHETEIRQWLKVLGAA
jgi:hypothetical protein